jgi:hypothetical protein
MFRTQGIEAETNFLSFAEARQEKKVLRLDHFYLGFILQST